MALRDIYKFKKETISDKAWVFPFGKYKDKSLQDVMDIDPGYLSFLQSKDICDFDSTIFDEIADGVWGQVADPSRQ